jgi:hypothetical protein
MFATTVMPGFGSTTPWLPSAKSGRRHETPEEIDATPLSLGQTPPALREAVLQFTEAFDSFYDQEIFRVVCAGALGARTLISNRLLSNPVLILEVGEISRVDPERAYPLVAFDQIQGELAVTQKELLVATGIRRRTYYSWKKPAAPRPRPSSLGRLWRLADALVDLRETLERPIAVWLHTSPERMAAFREGRFEDLVDFAVAMPESSKRGHGTSRRVGIAADVDVPIIKAGRPRVTVIERGAQR